MTDKQRREKLVTLLRGRYLGKVVGYNRASNGREWFNIQIVEVDVDHSGDVVMGVRDMPLSASVDFTGGEVGLQVFSYFNKTIRSVYYVNI